MTKLESKKQELVDRKKDLGNKIANVNTIIAEKKARGEACTLEIEMKSYYEKLLFPVKNELTELGNGFNEVYLKVVQKSVPLDIKLKLENITYHLMDSKLKMDEINRMEISLFNREDLDILSSKYPTAVKEVDRLTKSEKKNKLRARELMLLLNTRLIPDEQILVKEVKEFLSNIIN